MITGKDLIEMGYKPAKWFGEVIEKANDDNLTGDGLQNMIDSVLPPPQIEPQEPIEYFKNIRAECEEEQTNVRQVFETMDELLKTPTVVKAAVMPDACPTGEKGQIPVGGVVVAKNAIHPSMHSADICCSVMMTSLGNVEPKSVLDFAHKKYSFRHRRAI
jgi:tRNA-splicing ligase RtcB